MSSTSNQHDQHRLLMEQLAAGSIPDLPLGRHVLAAYGEYERKLPDTQAWQTGVFFFVRALRSSAELEKLSAKKALQEVERVLSHWGAPTGGSARGRVEAAWRKWFEAEPEDARAEFVVAWGKVRCAAGRKPFDEAWHRAQTEPITFGEDQVSLDSPGYRRFLSLAGWLQVATGPAAIWLPVRLVGERLGVSWMTVSNYRAVGATDGFLREVEKPMFPSGRATRLIFNVARVPMLKSRAHPNVLAWVEDRWRT